jgi:hypothetical protein
VLGKDQSVFGSIAELDSFFSRPKYDIMIKLFSNMCSSAACRSDSPCENTICPTVWNIVSFIDGNSNFTQLSDVSPPFISKNNKGEESGKGLVFSDDDRMQCDLTNLYGMYPPFLTQAIYLCVTPSNVNSLAYRCSPLFSELCFVVSDPRIRAFCQQAYQMFH